MRAGCFHPLRAAIESRVRITAAAPSEMLAELAAVTVPSFLKDGFSEGILAMSRVEGVSSVSTSRSPLRVFAVTAAISDRKLPLATAALARRADSVANSSWARRLKSYLLEVASAKQPMS